MFWALALTTDELQNMLNDRDVLVRLEAVHYLSELPDEEALPLLIEALQNDNSRVREEALEALRGIGKSCIPHLVSVWEKNPKLRKEILQIMVDLESVDMKKLLISFYKKIENEKNWNLKLLALKGEALLRESGALQQLSKYLFHPNPSVRETAAVYLGEIGNKTVLENLHKAVLKESVEDVLKKMVWAIGEIGDTSSIDILLQLIGEAGQKIADEAICALSKIDSKEGREAVMELWNMGQMEIKKAVVKYTDNRKILLEALKIDSLRKECIERITELGDKKLATKALEYFGTKDKDVQEAILNMAIALNLKEIEQKIWTYFPYLDNEIKEKALTALARVAPEAFAEGLKSLEGKDALRVCRFVRLNRIKQALPVLRAFAIKKSGPVQIEAILALGAMKDKQSLPILHLLVSSIHKKIRLAVAKSLGEIGSPRSIPYLQKLLTDSNPRVVREASLALQKIYQGS